MRLYGVVTDDGESFPYLSEATFSCKKDRDIFLIQKKDKHRLVRKHLGRVTSRYLPVTIIIEKGQLFHRNYEYEIRNRNPQHCN